MSIRSQKKRATSQEVEEPERTDRVSPKVFSTEFRKIVDNVPSTSTDEIVTQNFSDNPKTKIYPKKRDYQGNKSYVRSVLKSNHTST